MPSTYIPLKNHDTPIKVLFTGYLITVGIGYMFALIQILLTHGMADGKFGLSIDDIVYSYYGNRSGTVLEQQLEGAMKANAPEDERFQIIQWVRDGADEEAYKDQGIDKIIQERCVMCHNKEASGLPNFNEFAQLKKLAAQDEGSSVGTLTRGSHIHLFGISFIFMFVGIIFSFSETTNMKFKCIAVGMPYIFLVTDILSWWLTKYYPMFAWLVVFAGMGMAVSFIFMWVTSILEMWLFKEVYVDGIRHTFEQWKKRIQQDDGEIPNEKMAALLALLIKAIESGKGILLVIWDNKVLPFIKKLMQGVIHK